MASYLRRLKEFDTVTPLSLETRGPGVYNEPFLIEGNSILSTVFIASCDPGATLLVEYWDSTTGTEVGEEYPLRAHPLFTAPKSDRMTVTRIHNKPNLRATVVGGSIRFGVYVTVVSSFPSELDEALRLECEPADLLLQKALPVAGYECERNRWNVLHTKNGHLRVVSGADDGFGIDAFGRLRVSEARTLFTFVPRVGKQTATDWDEQTANGALVTFNGANSTIDHSTTTASGSRAIRQTYQRFIYTPAKSNIVLITANFGGKLANCRKRVGLFDTKDGWFFELDGLTPKVVLRSNIGNVVTDVAIPQDDWNEDKLDGTGPSGLTVDFSKTQILAIDYQWLGIGRVRFGFIINGTLQYCHYANHANIQAVLYSQHPHVPFRSEIENTGVTSAPGLLRTTCFSLAVEGDGKPRGRSLSVTSGTTEKSISATETYLFSVSLRPEFARQLIELISLQFIMSAGTKPTLIRIYQNATITSPSWVDAGDVSRVDRAALGWSGGKLMMEFVANLNNTSIVNLEEDAKTELRIGANIAETPVNLTVTAQTLGGSGSLVYVGFIREYI